MSRRQRNRPDIQKLRHEVKLLREEIKTLTDRINKTLAYNEDTLKAIATKIKESIRTEKDKAIKILETYRLRDKTFIRRFISWFGI